MNRQDKRLAAQLGVDPDKLQQIAEEANEWMSLGGLVMPVATQVVARVVDAMHDGRLEKAVRVAIASPTGVYVAHFPPQVARQLAEIITELAGQADTGLEVVRNG